MARKKKSAKATMKVRVTTVPQEGKSSSKTVEVPVTGASLAEVLKKAGISGEGRDLLVNGAPARLDTHVRAKDTVEAKDLPVPSESVQVPNASVQVSERPQGS